ncbi:MAG: hypothetical protein ACLQPH_16505 [Acidimicrobiales bacterium]
MHIPPCSHDSAAKELLMAPVGSGEGWIVHVAVDWTGIPEA